MIEVFKTNIRLKREALRLIKLMMASYPYWKINIDLQDCDKVLRVEGDDICPLAVTRLVAAAGYQCNVLE